MNVIIFDDSKRVCDDLKSQILSIDSSINVTTFTKWLHLETFIMDNYNYIDLVFMDIETPDEDKNGIQYASTIAKNYPLIKIIIISGYTQKYVQSILLQRPKVSPYGILQKPIDKKLLQEYLNLSKQELPDCPCFEFKIPKEGSIFIRYKDVIYVSKCLRDATIHTVNGTYTGYYSASEIFKVLNQFPNTFYQCSQNYIINIAYIKNVSNGIVTIKFQTSEKTEVLNIKLTNINRTSPTDKEHEILKLKVINHQ